MYNKVQRAFDRSIADAVAETKRINDAKPRRNVSAPKAKRRQIAPRGRLYRCPKTGATVWEPETKSGDV